MRKFAEVLRAFIIAILAILIINTTTITLLDKYVFNRDNVPETEPVDAITQEDDEGLAEDLMALIMTTDETEEPEEETIESFDEHKEKDKASALAMFSVPSLLSPAVDKDKKEDVSKQADAIYNKYYSILAGMQVSYEGRAASILNTAKNEYYAAVKGGEKSDAAKSRLYSKYFSILSGLLGECNGAVEGVLAQMTAELNAIGASTAGVGQLRGIYNSAVASYTGGY